jgi:hypothetical protein
LDEEDEWKKRGELRGMRERTFYDYNIEWEMNSTFQCIEKHCSFSTLLSIGWDMVGRRRWEEEERRVAWHERENFL